MPELKEDKEAGYSILETVVALSILLIASAGILTATHVLLMRQEKTMDLFQETTEAVRVDAVLKTFILKASSSGVDLNTLRGSPFQVETACENELCSMSLFGRPPKATLSADLAGDHLRVPLRSKASLEFRYLDERTLRDHWPVAATRDLPAPRLKGLALVQRGRVVALSKIQDALLPDCTFDDVSHTCRPPASPAPS